jgi:hypothetical protein
MDNNVDTIPLTPMPEVKLNKVEVTGMTFPQAIQKVIDGKKIARKEWENTDYCFLNGEWLSIHRNGNDYIWKVNDGDLNGNDWFVVEEVN